MVQLLGSKGGEVQGRKFIVAAVNGDGASSQAHLHKAAVEVDVNNPPHVQAVDIRAAAAVLQVNALTRDFPSPCGSAQAQLSSADMPVANSFWDGCARFKSATLQRKPARANVNE